MPEADTANYTCTICSAIGAGYYVDIPPVALPSGGQQRTRLGMCPQCKDTPQVRALIRPESHLNAAK